MCNKNTNSHPISLFHSLLVLNRTSLNSDIFLFSSQFLWGGGEKISYHGKLETFKTYVLCCRSVIDFLLSVYS